MRKWPIFVLVSEVKFNFFVFSPQSVAMKNTSFYLSPGIGKDSNM